MKLIHIIALALAFSASYPVYAQANKSGVKTFASRQEDPSPIEITAYENRIKVEWKVSFARAASHSAKVASWYNKSTPSMMGIIDG